MTAGLQEQWWLENGEWQNDGDILWEPVEDWRRSGALAALYDGTVSTLAFQLLALPTVSLPVLRTLRLAVQHAGNHVIVV